MGFQCPKGSEVTLLLKMDDFWPGFGASPEAVEAIFAGFADRFSIQLPPVEAT
jgi:hypothetical protein